MSEVIITASKIASISDSDSTAGSRNSRWDEFVREGQSTKFEMSKQITTDAEGSEGKR